MRDHLSSNEKLYGPDAVGSYNKQLAEAFAENQRLRAALERATNFIGRWAAVYNAQERTVLAKEFREAEREARNVLRPADETTGEQK